METRQKNKRSVNTKRSKETLEERVHRHLNDINSVITEDDIRNVKTELAISGETSSEQQPADIKRKEKKPGKQKKENEINTEEKHTTPWELLSEGYD
jgi:hypothetical protein